MGISQLLGGIDALQQDQNYWQQLAAQQGLYNQLFSAGTANTATNTNTYVVSAYPVEPVVAKPKGPETALEWLDRRVDEVRLPLAA